MTGVQTCALPISPLAGKTILLHAEAGLGDTLQFCRYAELVARLGAQTIVALPPALVDLVKNVPGVHQTLVKGEISPPFDYHCPLMSLPLAFGTTLESIPANIPYLYSEPSRVALWRKRLGEKKHPRVGLVWSGNPAHKNDRNRSIPLTMLQCLLDSHNFEWFSLQKEVRQSDQAYLDSRPDIRHFGAGLHDFGDTAALVELMDLVITVDSSVAHLCGAMGRPFWLLIPYLPDWRWLLQRNDSPWYPSARLFRQRKHGDWTEVLERLNLELANLLTSRPARRALGIPRPDSSADPQAANADKVVACAPPAAIKRPDNVWKVVIGIFALVCLAWAVMLVFVK